MSSLPTPTIIRHALLTRNRLLALLVALCTALAVLVAPEFSPSASAAPAVRNAAIANGWARNMLALLNAERHANHLASLTMNSKLIRSAHGHNATMAKANAMSHQLRGEAVFSARISKAGYPWHRVAENIGWNYVQTKAGLLALQRQMYNEKAPNNGHRVNILDRSLKQIGIDVYFDKPHQKMWFTQDFGQPQPA